MTRILIVLLILFSSSVKADVSAEQQLEIDHLLNFVKHSSCKMNRNGTVYEGSKAASHIQKKYQYFKKNIKTTEQFIELSATKSTMSGNYYTVKCAENKPYGTKEWLLEELRIYRENANT